MRRRGALLAGATVLIAGWALMGPSQLGGPVSYVVVHGDSMEPSMRQGDLVLTRQSSDYEVGDVVAYRNRDLRRVVLHRIIAVEGDHYRLQGDNNNFTDSFTPTADEILGSPWLRAPGAGGILEGLREPRNATILVGVAVFLAFGGHATSRRRKQRSPATRPARPGGPSALPSPSSAQAWTAPRVAAAVVAVVIAGGMTAMLFLRPTRLTAFESAAYQQSGRFSYSAQTAPNPVYPDGTVTTGDPAFLELVDGLDVEFVYSLDTEQAVTVAGTGRLVATLADDIGWSRSFVVQDDAAFNGTHVTLAGRLDLSAVRGLIGQVQEATKVNRAGYLLTLAPHIQVEGDLAGTAFSDRFDPVLEFALDQQVFRPVPADDAEGTADPLAPTEAGRVDVATSAARRLGPLTVPAARTLSLGLLAAAAGGAVIWTRRSAGAAVDEAVQINTRHRRWLVPVDNATTGGAVVDVSSFDGLMRLAEQHDQLVLHEERAGRHVYAVRAGSVAYRYEPVPARTTNGNGNGNGNGNVPRPRLPRAGKISLEAITNSPQQNSQQTSSTCG